MFSGAGVAGSRRRGRLYVRSTPKSAPPPHSPVLSYTAIGRLPSEVTGGHICSTVTSPGPGSTTSSSRLTIIEPTLRPISPVPLAGTAV